jgi:hypothetical protein
MSNKQKSASYAKTRLFVPLTELIIGLGDMKME